MPRSTPGNYDIVPEGANVVEVQSADQPRKQTLCSLDRLHHQHLFLYDQREAFRPASSHVDQQESLDERAPNQHPAMRTRSTSQNPGGGSLQPSKVRTGTSRRTADDEPTRRGGTAPVPLDRDCRPPPLARQREAMKAASRRLPRYSTGPSRRQKDKFRNSKPRSRRDRRGPEVKQDAPPKLDLIGRSGADNPILLCCGRF
jgi:hypothetical protein